MNTKPISLTLSESIEGWTIAARARRLSINTLNGYGCSFRRFQAFIGHDLQLAAITTNDIKQFMAGLDCAPTPTLAHPARASCSCACAASP